MGWRTRAVLHGWLWAVTACLALAQQPLPAPPGKAYSGAPMSLQLHEVEVRAALRAVADFTGLNIIVSDTVTGQVSLRLHRVPWDQVLDLIAQARGLQVRRQGQVLWVAPRAEIAAREKAQWEDVLALQQLEPLQTQAFALSYARAPEVQARLLGQGVVGSVAGMATAVPWHAGHSAGLTSDGTAYGSATPPGFGAGAGGGPASPVAAPALSLPGSARILSPRGSAIADARTNQLFVTDVAERLTQVVQIVGKLDVPLRQVLIEARIVQANDSFGQSLGVRLGGAGQNGNMVWGANAAGAVANTNPVAGQGTAFQTAGQAINTGGQFVNLPAAALNGVEPTGFAVSLFNAGKNRLLSLELSALEADGKGHVVSSPRVVTANQNKAVIEQGTELPYQTAAGTGITTIAFRKANLRLEVTPQITPEGGIVLDLDIHKDSVGQSTPAGFAIDTKHVNTQVRVDDGGTVMIGGIYETTDLDDVYKVPGLGDLPLLGALFRNRRQARTRQELLVFITPKMLNPRAPAR